MKVLFRVAIALSLVLSSAAFVLGFAFSDSQRLATIGTTEYSVPFHINGTNVSTDDALSFFNNLSSTYNVSIVKTTETVNDGEATTIKSGVFSTETYPVEQLVLTSGAFPERLEEFVATTDSDDPNQSGLMYDFGGDDPVVVQSLDKEYSETGKVDGIYSIESTVFYDRAVVAEISDYFSIDENSLLEKTSSKVSGISGLFYITLGALGLLLLLTALINALSPILKLKLINSQKLLGWSTLSIWFDSIKGSLTFSVVIACLILSVCYFIPGWSRQFFVSLLAVLVITLIVMIALSTVSLFATKRIKAVGALKGDSPFRLSLAGAAILKILFVVCISISSVPIAQNIEILIKNHESQKYWVEYGNYYVISQFIMQDNDKNSLLTGDPALSDKFASLYDDLNNELGAIYARSVDYPEIIQSNDFSDTYQTLTVNPNYLKRHHVVDMNDNPFDFPENEANIIILIPQSRESETEEFVEQAKDDWVFNEESEKRRYANVSDVAENSESKNEVPEVSFYIYNDAHKFFSFNERVAVENDYLLESPLIKVVTNHNIQQSEKWYLQTIGLNAPIKIPSLTDEDKAAFYEIAYQHGFTEESIFIDTLVNCIASEIAQSQNSMNNLMLVFIVLFLLCAVSSFALIHIVLTSRRRWLDVARYLGYSLLTRHWQTILFIVGIYAVCISVVGLVTGSVLACMVVLCAAILDAIISALVVWRLEARNTALLLKGQ